MWSVSWRYRNWLPMRGFSYTPCRWSVLGRRFVVRLSSLMGRGWRRPPHGLLPCLVFRTNFFRSQRPKPPTCSWINEILYLSSRQPWEARSCESGEKAKLLIPTLWSFNLCFIYLVWKSQMMMSAGNPGKVFWALAMYLPSGEILIAE